VPTRLTHRQLNRATLARQLLLKRERLSAVEAVQRIVAVQAQEPASPYIALWDRVLDFDAGVLDTAFADRSVVKASLVRLTLHAVHADDYPPFHHAMASSLRASRLFDSRFTSSGLSAADVDGALPELLAFMGQPRSKAEIEAALEGMLGGPNPWAWWALRTFAPFHHAPTGGPWSFGLRPAFVAAGEAQRPATPDEAVEHLLLRYLQAFGPASTADFAQFTMLRKPPVTQAARALADRIVEVEGPDGKTLFDIPDGIIPAEDTPAPPRLLAMWDSVLLAYDDRSRVIPPAYRSLVIRRNGDALPTLLVDGLVAGVWRPVEGGIEATAFHRLSDEVWAGLATEAAALIAFLADRDPNVYRRYGHWWAALPGVETRLLPG
jgi:hypothetical protein